MSKAERLACVSREHPMSLSEQCRLLGVPRCALYRQPRTAPERDLALMREMDRMHTDHPIYGSRQMVAALRFKDIHVCRDRVRRLMRVMGLTAVVPKPATSVKGPSHKVFPYLLGELTISEPNHVWCTDITYIPVRCGFLYLVAILDWATRCVLSWEMSNSMDVGFCLDALHGALRTGAAPRIFNTDQGVQFTAKTFTDAVKAAGAQVSMDGKGRWVDNVRIERLWRSLKCEAVYLHDLADGLEAHRVIAEWMRFYNEVRPHSSLDGRTPRIAYEGVRPPWEQTA